MPLTNRRFYLAVLVLSQFAGTSVWFVGNAILPELSIALGITPSIAIVTTVVQVGFIVGTLLFSLFSIADRFGASMIFLTCCVAACLLNLSIIWFVNDNTSLYFLRFLTGFVLAGIYPVGMKIAADLFKEGLGNALGFLVGALVLGTAFPHILQAQLQQYSYSGVITGTSILCLLGGIFVYFLLPAGDGKTWRFPSHLSFFSLFRSPALRSAAFGYFGHMWELYAFWAFVPFLIRAHNEVKGSSLPLSLWSFIIIGSGFAGCVAGGAFSKKMGSMKVARSALYISGTCCLLSPVLINSNDVTFAVCMCIWGCAAAADSPQFSTLVAHAAPLNNRGTALTLVTSLGFAITIATIQLTAYTTDVFGAYGLIPLAVGPMLGIYWTRKKMRPSPFPILK